MQYRPWTNTILFLWIRMNNYIYINACLLWERRALCITSVVFLAALQASVWVRIDTFPLPRSSLRSMSALVGLITASTSNPAKLVISLWMRFSWKERRDMQQESRTARGVWDCVCARQESQRRKARGAQVKQAPLPMQSHPGEWMGGWLSHINSSTISHFLRSTHTHILPQARGGTAVLMMGFEQHQNDKTDTLWWR